MYVPFRRHRWITGLVLAGIVAVAAPAKAQVIDYVDTDTPNSGPTDITAAPDGTLWFVETTGNRIGSINPARTDVVEVNLKIANSQPTAITVDRNGRVWFTEAGTNRIGLYTPWTGSLVEYYWGGSNLGLAGIAADSLGRIWFTESFTNRIGMLDPGRLILQYYRWTTVNLGLQGIECDSLGRVWFTEFQANRVGVLDPNWNYVYDYYYSGGLGPYAITIDADDDVWFTEQRSGTYSLLDVAQNFIFQFDGVNGANSQPRYLDTFQNAQNQTIVAWAEPTPGNSLVGLYNADLGVKSQIQASSPFAAPTGVTFAPDNSLWFTEQATSQVSGWFYQSMLARRPAAKRPVLASLELLPSHLEARPAVLGLDASADTQVVLVKKENKQGTAKARGREKKAEVKREQAEVQQISLNTADEYQPPKKARKTKKGGGGNQGNQGNQGRGGGQGNNR